VEGCRTRLRRNSKSLILGEMQDSVVGAARLPDATSLEAIKVGLVAAFGGVN